MLYLILGIIIVIFPLLLNVDTLLSKENSKIYFVIKIYFIKLIAGYIQKTIDGVAIHYSNKKALLIKNYELLGLGKKFEPFKDYHLKTLKISLDVGNNEKNINRSICVFIINYILCTTEKILLVKKNYINFKYKINVFEKSNILNAYLNTKVLFNLLTVLISIIKILGEKITYVIKR